MPLLYVPSVKSISVTNSGAVVHRRDSAGVGAVSATIEYPIGFHSVADDFAAAMGTRGRKRMDRTLETVEGMRLIGQGDHERFVVFVTTGFTTCHDLSSFL